MFVDWDYWLLSKIFQSTSTYSTFFKLKEKIPQARTHAGHSYRRTRKSENFYVVFCFISEKLIKFIKIIKFTCCNRFNTYILIFKF